MRLKAWTTHVSGSADNSLTVFMVGTHKTCHSSPSTMSTSTPSGAHPTRMAHPSNVHVPCPPTQPTPQHPQNQECQKGNQDEEEVCKSSTDAGLQADYRSTVLGQHMSRTDQSKRLSRLSLGLQSLLSYLTPHHCALCCYQLTLGYVIGKVP
jgi:hypothetical protein